MPTHEEDGAFLRDFRGLTDAQRERFRQARAKMIEDLKEMEAGDGLWLRTGLVRKLSGRGDLYELRWAPDGRAIFSIGPPQQPGLLHIQWHRCGTHEILP